VKQKDRDALRKWEEYKRGIKNATFVDPSMSPADIRAHRDYLERHPAEWIRYFFPKYAKYPFAPFQLSAIRRILGHPEWYEVLSWARELAKSTVCMFIVMYLVLTGRKKNVLLTSNSETNAIRLLSPYRANLEANERIRAYYGEQVSTGSWTEKEFITKGGAAFRALGAGNSPRGSRNEEIRPDVEIMDDFDTDEECLNPEVLKKKWEWFEDALYKTRSISEPTLVLWCGNIIARDCCITRAGAMADHWDIVNIRDKAGKSTWPEKNTEEKIDRALSKTSSRSNQKEYFNNPVHEGRIFKNLAFGKVPALSKFKYLVIYGDPAPGEHKGKKASYKAVWLMGEKDGKKYVIKGFLDQVVQGDFIMWYVELIQFVDGKSNVFSWMENNKLQDPFFQKVFKPMIRKIRIKLGIALRIREDAERKTDKATRIESNLEPLDREGDLIFNEKEKDNPHMQRLIDQFKLFDSHLPYPADGPDCIEGGNRVLDNRKMELRLPDTVPSKVFSSSNRHRL
jgi:DNA-binding cell septation regulator SpoVG